MLSHLVVFGDELALSSQGKSWTEQVAQALKLRLINYAQEGASTLSWKRSYTTPSSSIEVQVDRFLSSHQASPRNCIFLVVTGLTDALIYKATPEDTMQGVAELSERLKEGGATRIFVCSPYSLNRLPRSFGGVEEEELHRLSFYSAMLPVLLNRKGIQQVDFYSLFARAMAKPTQYGLAHQVEPQFFESVTTKEEAGALFLDDGIRPSQAAHRLMADEAISVLGSVTSPVREEAIEKPVVSRSNSKQEFLSLPPELFKRPGSPGLRTS